MKSRTVGVEAKEEKIEPPWLRTEKESGKAVKEKLRAFATQCTLNLRDRLSGVIQKQATSQLPPTRDATMVWKVESIKSKNVAPGFGRAEKGAARRSSPDLLLESVLAPELGGTGSAAGAPAAGAPIFEGTVEAPRGHPGKDKSRAWVGGRRRLWGTEPRAGREVAAPVDERSSAGDALSPARAWELMSAQSPLILRRRRRIIYDNLCSR
jgi:hypothetical protein